MSKYTQVTAAIRECATNRGLPVKGKIAEDSGLTSLRHRVENSGGIMRKRLIVNGF